MVDEYLDEREQAEQLQQWFKENWLWMAAGIGLGLGGLYGWQGWNAYLDGKSQDAGQRFVAMLQAFDAADQAQGRELAAEITSKYASTPYADQAVLVLARVDAEAGQLDDAAARLRQVMEQSKDAELALVARLRLARVQLAQGKQDAALATLDGAATPAVEAAVAELRGDALLAKGDQTAALIAYRQAMAAGTADAGTGLVDAELLQLKIDELSAAGAAPKSGS
ncbi:MAG TPA: tetratricopeptide repeat protein [Steroidobacteraceae bacterium]|nr:tetratricopeptide repeat protein [Steroidobacteraceae bacterium]